MKHWTRQIHLTLPPRALTPALTSETICRCSSSLRSRSEIANLSVSLSRSCCNSSIAVRNSADCSISSFLAASTRTLEDGKQVFVSRGVSLVYWGVCRRFDIGSKSAHLSVGGKKSMRGFGKKSPLSSNDTVVAKYTSSIYDRVLQLEPEDSNATGNMTHFARRFVCLEACRLTAPLQVGCAYRLSSAQLTCQGAVRPCPEISDSFPRPLCWLVVPLPAQSDAWAIIFTCLIRAPYSGGIVSLGETRCETAHTWTSCFAGLVKEASLCIEQ